MILRAALLAGVMLIPASADPKAALSTVEGLALSSVEGVQVRASVDRTAVWVGDRVTYTVEIVCARGVDVLLDDLAKDKLRVNGLDVVSSDAAASTDAADRTSHVLRYVLTTSRVDLPVLSIEPLNIRYYARRAGQRLEDVAPAGEIEIPGAVIAFRSTLPDNQPSYQLRDGRASASRHPALARAQQIGTALVVVALAPAAFLLAAAIRRKTQAASRTRRPRVRHDHRAALERLRSLDVASEDDRRHAYDEISRAVREHLSAHAHVQAAALTADEVGNALETGRSRIPREAAAALLAACDEARYSPPQAIPSAQACRNALAAAEQLLAGRSL